MTVLPPLRAKLGDQNLEIVIRKALDSRKIVDGKKLTDADGVKYDPFTYEADGKKYEIRPVHVTLDEVSEHGNSRCNTCNGQGYVIVNILKRLIKNPADHAILSKTSLENLTDEEKKHVVEEEKKSTTWRILMPCACAIKKMRKKDPNFFASDGYGIMIRLDYEVLAS